MDVNVCIPGKIHAFLYDLVEDVIDQLIYSTQSLNPGLNA